MAFLWWRFNLPPPPLGPSVYVAAGWLLIGITGNRTLLSDPED